MTPRGRLALMIDRDLPPEQLVPVARAAERLGVDEVWVVEDIGWGGGISAAATVLAATERVHVTIGIMPAPLRNPVLAAMEIATIARLHPGRFSAGIGHGVQDWMRQVGAAHASILALLEETFAVLRGLLAGQRVTVQGREVSVSDIALVHPPTIPVPLLAGVSGPRSLQLAGRIADGVILVEGSGPEQIADALTRAADRTEPYELAVLSHLYVGDDATAVDAAVGEVARDFFGRQERDFTIVAGTPSEGAAVIAELWAAGATTVVLRPIGEPVAQLQAVLAAL